MIRASARAASLPPSGIREIVNLALATPGIARLEIGEPSAPTPPHVLDAARACLDGPTGYTQSSGMPVLREAIAERLDRVHGVTARISEIVVTQGAVQGIAAALAAVLEPGGEVLVPDPAWPVYDSQVALLGGTPVHYPLLPSNGYLPDPDDVARRLTPRTRALLLNSPSNPTGSVIDAALMDRLVTAAASRGVAVISDEVYDEIVLDGAHVRAAPFAPDQVITAYSFSKTYSMTGWRIGYLHVPPALATIGERIQETLLSCLAQPVQMAALAALTGPQDSVRWNLADYRERRDLAVRLLADQGLEAHRPEGAFYLMTVLPPGTDSRRAALELVDRGVSVAPGSAFGSMSTEFLRLSLASSAETLERGIAIIGDWARETSLGRAAPGGAHATR